MVLADWVPTFNLVNLSISILVIAVVAFVSRLAGYARVFISEIPLYKHVARHPTTWSLVDLYDQTGGFEEKFIAGMRNSDGSFKPVVNLGPWGDGHTYVGVTDAEAFRTILPDLQKFPKSPAMYRWYANLIGDGLIVASGELWRRQRKMVTPLFHMAMLKRSVPVMVDITKELIKFLKEKQDSYHPAKSLMALHTMRVIVNLAFGGDFDPVWMLHAWEKVEHAFNDWTWGWCLFGEIWNYLPIPAAAGFDKARGEIRKRLADAVDARREKLHEMAAEGKELDEQDQNNLLYCLLGGENLEGEEFTTQEIVDQAITFLFAGHDTSSVSLAWSCYFMAKHPECFAKLREEADRVLGDRNPTPEDINELHYTRNFMKESMRMRPPIPLVDRVAAEDTVVAGTPLKKGTYLGMFLWNIGRDARYYKNPEDFIPDRWNDSNLHDPFSFVPFSAGPRICVGYKFAHQEIMIALAMIARELDIAYDTSSKIFPVFEGVIAPKGLRLKFSERVRT